MIAADLLPDSFLIAGGLVSAIAILAAVRAAPWLEIITDSRRQHLIFGTLFCLFILWLVRRDFTSGLSFHFIGMSAVTLILDWPLAILVGYLCQAGLCLLGLQDVSAVGVNGLIQVLIPVTITRMAMLYVERWQPRNLFVYIFCCGFFPAALTVVVILPLAYVLLWMGGLYEMPSSIGDFIPYIWMVMFPEAFINGAVISALVVYYPEWLETFNRTRYLQAPWNEDEK